MKKITIIVIVHHLANPCFDLRIKINDLGFYKYFNFMIYIFHTVPFHKSKIVNPFS